MQHLRHHIEIPLDFGVEIIVFQLFDMSPEKPLGTFATKEVGVLLKLQELGQLLDGRAPKHSVIRYVDMQKPQIIVRGLVHKLSASHSGLIVAEDSCATARFVH